MRGRNTLIAILFLAFLVAGLTGGCGVKNGEAESGRATVVMTGRSTMELWFKHWNWPRFLRLRGTYRAWPIH